MICMYVDNGGISTVDAKKTLSSISAEQWIKSTFLKMRERAGESRTGHLEIDKSSCPVSP